MSADRGAEAGEAEGGRQDPSEAVRSLRDEWRRADDARRREVHDAGSAEDEERQQAREQGTGASLDSLDRIRADAPESDLETRRAADAAEREMERSRRRGRPRPR